MTQQDIQTIEKILKRGERVELIPVKDGVKIYVISRRKAK